MKPKKTLIFTLFFLLIPVMAFCVSFKKDPVKWLLKFDREMGVTDYLYQRAEFDRFMSLDDPILNEALQKTESNKEEVLRDAQNLKKVKKILKMKNLTPEIKLLAKTWERILSQWAVDDTKVKKMIDKMQPVKSEIEKAFHSYQHRVPHIDKEKYNVKKDTYSRNELYNIMADSNDWERNRQLFLSALELGPYLIGQKHKPADLIAMRNDFARRQGFKDFIEMKYHYMFGKTTDRVFKEYFEPILEATRPPAKKAVAEFKKKQNLEKFFPWHMSYARFGQNKILDPYLPLERLDGSVRDSFKKIGFNLYDKKRYDYANDLYPRKNKYSHGACWLVLNSKTVMDDSGKEIFIKGISRYAANFTKGGIDEYETAFHETGHAVHNMEVRQSYTGTANVNLLQDYFAPLMEGIAMTFEYLTYDPEWLLKYGKGSKRKIKKAYSEWLEKSIPWRAFNIRRQLLFVYMERDLYKKKPSEWTKTWWDYSKNFLFTEKDEKTDYEKYPNWTRIPHYWGNNSGTYQQYIIAYMIRAQTYATLKAKHRSMLKNEPWEEFTKAYLAPGNTGYWDKMIVNLTGEELTPKYFMAELTGKKL